jgi:hypothetical protein
LDLRERKDHVAGKKIAQSGFHNLYFSQNIFYTIKSTRMRGERYAARMRKTKNACKILVERLEGKRPIGRLGVGVDEKIILKCILRA